MINEGYQETFDKVKQGMLGNVSKLIKKYKNPDAIIYGKARKEAKKVQDMENTDKLKEAVKAALMNEKKKPFPDLTGDGKVTRADILKARGVELKETNLYPGEEWSITPEGRFWIVTYRTIDGTKEKVFQSEDEAKEFTKTLNEDLDLGHEDDEPHMLKADLYKIGKYAMELYQMVDQFEGQGEVDFPAWWQSKITNAASMISSAKHYLEFELKEPEIDAMVGVAQNTGAIDNEISNIEEIKAKVLEKLTAKSSMKTYIDDFSKSKAPQFKGKSKEKKRQMAIAAKLSK